MAKKKTELTREQASTLYKELQLKMKEKEKSATQVPQVSSAKPGLQQLAKQFGRISFMPAVKIDGQRAALLIIGFFAVSKVILSVFEYFQIGEVLPVQASINSRQAIKPIDMLRSSGKFDNVEVEILTTLDNRRAQLETRSDRLDQREDEIKRQEMEYAARYNELKLLTERLKLARNDDQRKRKGQLEQLAKVYSAMNPEEAALLIEQLDVTIALSLIQNMPDKRIGQILSLMSPDKALTITRLLSGVRG